MKKEWADKWVAALRTGPYTQTRRTLRGSKGFCCLGVLCDLVKDEPLVQGHWQESDRGQYGFTVAGAYADQILPSRAQRLVGMVSSNGSLRTSDGAMSTALSTLNDDGLSFDEIASIIEEHWQDL
jgi:hypothetical protein